jgi:primosomal protein N''
METGSRFKQIAFLKDRLLQQAENLRKQAAGMPAGIRREELVAKACQAERVARVDEWLSSQSGVQARR